MSMIKQLSHVVLLSFGMSAFANADFVNVKTLDDSIVLDMKYASSDNFFKAKRLSLWWVLS